MAPASTLTLNAFTFVRSPPSSSYRTLRFSLTLTERAFVVCANGDLLGVPTAARASMRPHSSKPVGRDDAELELAVVGTRVLERLDPAEELADVAEQDAARLALVPADAVDLDLGAKRLRAQVLRPRPHVRDAAESLLETAVPASRIIAASKPAPAMTANRSPLKRPTSSLRRSPRSPIATACSMSLGIPRLVAKRFAVPAGIDREARLRAGEHVDAALHHPVAAPREDELRALVEGASNLRRRLAALRHLAPERIVDSLGLEHATKLGQPAAERLPGVRDDRDLHVGLRARRLVAAAAARSPGRRTRARSAAAMPTTTPPADVQRVMHAAIHARRCATNVTIARTNVQATARKTPFVNLDVSSRTRPP